ncbi:hypothetical protein J1N35_037535 [Gossypium stocksii]|uniref:Uncharacterized protein n=1 Tax=Gossypium stocksii TaxID=47602 RepID=A0A9D3UKD8_9ROSI|nr:hypothetical protein J1N35_037535 [Gossypium stocksii]
MPKEELVREFYANLSTPYVNEVLVRKKNVPLTSKSINDLFNLPNIEEDKYFAMMTNINWDFFNKEYLNLVAKVEPNELNEPEFDESSTKSKLKADLVNETEEAETEGEPNRLELRVELNVAEPVEPSANPKLTILMPISSNTIKK